MYYPRKHWEQMSEYDLGEFILDIFKHYRSNGFPYYNKTHDEMIHEIQTMDKFFGRGEVLITNNTIKQTMHCLGTAWTFFPHSWNVKCNGKMTPFEAFNDDVKFKKVIRKRLRRGGYMNDSGIRKELKTNSNIQAVSNFRPSSARAIYDKYGGGKVYDPSCGFGGRLLGAISSPKVTEYIGTEPSTDTYNGLISLKEKLGNKPITIIHRGSEDYIPEDVDFIFTSPPYFNTEVYSNEYTQSCNKYPQKEYWLNKYLRKTIDNCYEGLKKGGVMAINIANVKNYPTLEQDFNDIMSEKFTYIETLRYALSIINKNGFKYEPIFVYKKE
jgi:hypothetical protein